MSEEKWIAVPDTNGKIEVSNLGRVRSLLRDCRILKATPDSKGYLRVCVTIDGVKHHYKVHRLVAQGFIDNSNNLPQVNHKDGNKANNSVDNLEWVTNKENADHAIRSGLWDNVLKASAKHNESVKTPVIATDVITGEVRKFSSVSEAERFFNSRHISDVLNGKRSKAAGQFFERG